MGDAHIWNESPTRRRQDAWIGPGRPFIIRVYSDGNRIRPHDVSLVKQKGIRR